MDDRGVRRGSWVYPIKEDPEHKGAGCSGPAVQAGSGLTVPGLAEVASCRFATRPASRFQKTPLAFHPRTFLGAATTRSNSPRTRCIARCNSTNAVNNSSARTMKRFPSSRCASTIQIVRPLESIAATQPQLHPGFAEIVGNDFPILQPATW